MILIAGIVLAVVMPTPVKWHLELRLFNPREIGVVEIPLGPIVALWGLIAITVAGADFLSSILLGDEEK